MRNWLNFIVEWIPVRNNTFWWSITSCPSNQYWAMPLDLPLPALNAY